MNYKLLTILSLLVLLTGCASKPAMHQPSDEEIRKAAMDQYDHLMKADGSGGYHADEIEVLRTRPGSIETECFAEVRAKGYYKHPPLANPKPDEPFDETREVPLIWVEDKWLFHKDE